MHVRACRVDVELHIINLTILANFTELKNILSIYTENLWEKIAQM